HQIGVALKVPPSRRTWSWRSAGRRSSADTVRIPFFSFVPGVPGLTAQARCSALRPRGSVASIRSGTDARSAATDSTSQLFAALKSPVFDGFPTLPIQPSIAEGYADGA